jgi:hypothetical protein
LKLRRLLLLLLLSLGATPAVGSEADRRAGAASPITAANLFETERTWPYRVVLTEAWQPPGRGERVPAGTNGVLIRVEPGELARIDFAREGKYEVPIAKTDLVENANRIQRGELVKPEPNFVTAIGTKLLDSRSNPPQLFPPDEIADRRFFLCVFADATARNFAELASSLRPLAQHSELVTVFFPQGRQSDAEILTRLRASDWIVPFLFQHLSEPYTATLLREGTPIPGLMLMTNEGRVLFQDAWQPGAIAKLESALDAGSAKK